VKYIVNIFRRTLLIIRSIIGELFTPLRLRFHVKIQFSILFRIRFVVVPERDWIPCLKCDVPWFVCGVLAIQHIVVEPANYMSDCDVCSE
jgi:hypothetical protein